MKEGQCIDGPRRGEVFFSDAPYLQLDEKVQPLTAFCQDVEPPEFIQMVTYNKKRYRNGNYELYVWTIN